MGKPAGMLPYEKNCVAMAFSKLKGIGVHETIQSFLDNAWIASPKELENENAILKICNALNLQPAYTNIAYATLKMQIRRNPNGRYFAVNTFNNNFNSGHKAHAFTIIKNGSIGIAGNNAEESDKPYHQQILPFHKITVWGPLN